MRVSRLVVVGIALLLVGAVVGSAQGFFEFDYEVSPLGGDVNSGENDYAPVESVDGERLFFTSYRSNGSIGEADIYQMSRPGGTPGGSWTRLMNPGSPFNTKRNDGSAALFRQDKMMIFATEGRSDGLGSTDLYAAKIENGRITTIRTLGSGINSENWESQPAISPDENTLYFVSDRDGGQGKGDIWMATKSGEDSDGFPTWSNPVNLGPEVNSRKDERSPSIALDGRTLYFASNGHDGFGGYDIYMAGYRNGVWSNPANLGSIINSSRDDLFFFAPRSDHPFYFSSARSGGAGELDIYSGTPNVFGRGLFQMTLNMVDDAGNGVDGIAYVIDQKSGDTISRIQTNSGRADYVVYLPAGRSYRVVGISNGITQERRLADVSPEESEIVRLLFGKLTLERIDLSNYSIPFFVTGYYRPNTAEVLEDLFSLKQGVLKPAGYVEEFARYSDEHKRYSAWAKDVDAMFSTVRQQMLENILPRFAATAAENEVLEIRVTGYTDPQPFEGIYYESREATYLDRSGASQRVTQGSTITNRELSGLRAFYSVEQLDKMLAEAPAALSDLYKRLKGEGRIRYVAVAGDVATNRNGERFETQRRITVVLEPVTR